MVLALCFGLLAAGVAKACYYEALNLENPADYYYRWCYAHVSLSLFFLDFSLTSRIAHVSYVPY